MPAPDRHERVNAIFQVAADLDLTGRARLLDEQCAGDLDLRRQIERVLRAFDEGTPNMLKSSAPAMLRQQLRLRPGDVLDERFRIDRVIGEGGMGTVYTAEQIRPVTRLVAVKVIKPGMDTAQVIARFEAERQALALMNHPNIARVFDAGATDAGHPYFVMELVDGLPITEHCDTYNLSTRARIELFIKVCQAVQHAHQKGIIHRDLKPTNVIVTADDGDPKIIDFGIAKAIQRPLTDATLLTEHHQIVGTPQYMSPEQVAGVHGDVDTRSDVYALGAMLYQVLAGRTPFEWTQMQLASPSEIQRIVQEVDPQRPSTRLASIGSSDIAAIAAARGTHPTALRKTLRGDLDWVIMKCLSKERHRRYETSDALAQDLRRHLDHEPVEAGPPGAAYRIRKFVGRNRVAVTAGVLIMATLLVGLSVSTVALMSAITARKRADATAAHLDLELAAGRIEAGRLHGYDGNLRHAEPLLWKAFLRDPDSLHAYWALWELYSRHPLHARFIGHDRFENPPHSATPNEIRTLAYSPDGVLIASAGRDMLIKLWDARTLECKAVLSGHAGDVESLAFHPDGDTLVSGGADDVLLVWDLRTMRTVRRLDEHSGMVHAVRYSPDGRLMASASSDGTVRLWNADSFAPVSVIDNRRLGAVALAFSADSRLLACGNRTGPVHLIDAVTGESSAWLEGHAGQVLSAAFDPSGRILATGSTDKFIMLWDVASGERLRIIPGNNGTIQWLQFIDEGRRLLAGGRRRLDIWDVASCQRERVLPAVGTGALDPEGRMIAGGGQDGSIMLLELAPEGGMLRLEHHSGATSGRIARDGTRIATADSAGTVRLWDAKSGKLLSEFHGHDGRIRAIDFSADGTLLATGGDDNLVRLWDLTSNACVKVFDNHLDVSSDSLCLSPDGTLLAHTGPGGIITVRHLANGTAITIPTTSSQAINLQFSPDGATLATISRDARVRFWTPGGEPKGMIDSGVLQSQPWSLRFSHDGRQLISGAWASTVQVWDLQTKANTMNLEGHDGTIWCLDTHPLDPRLIASGSDAGTVKIWDILEQRCLATLDAFERAPVLTVGFMPDGRKILATSGVGDVVLWDLDHYDRRLAGNLEWSLRKFRDDLGGEVDEQRLRAWARTVLGRPAG